LEALIFAFGVAAVLGGYLSGHAVDRWGPVPVLAVILAVFSLNHFLPTVSADRLATSLVYMAVWGVVGWGTVLPQQHRLLAIAGPAAPVALSLHAYALYLGIGLGGLLGGYLTHAAGADALWLPAGACGALALVLLPLSVAREPCGRAASNPVAGR
jgi:MFS transporter, DHA1 family, inner membrane transport protein